MFVLIVMEEFGRFRIIESFASTALIMSARGIRRVDHQGGHYYVIGI